MSTQTEKPATYGGSIVIPHRCKVSQVCSKDYTRPILTHAYLRGREDGLWICATDGYIACAVRVSSDVRDAEEGWVPIGALRHMEAGRAAVQMSHTAWRITTNDGYATFDVLPTVTEDNVFPDLEKLNVWGTEGTFEPAFVLAMGINPKLMARLGAGLGAHDYGCRFEFMGALKPIRVTPLSSPDADRVGLHMPIRLDV